MKKINWHVIALAAILVIAAGLRLWQLDYSDVINDEAFIAFRSIGLIDFLSSPYQTTPWEWFSPIPAWAHLSFHDHPPVLFLIQHLFFALFGVSAFVLRLPLALAGIVSVWLVYLIGTKLFSRRAGLYAAALLAVSSYHVWISRIGLQESMVIMWLLLALYLFLRARQNHRHWQWGIAFGLALLTKYTALFLLPTFLIIQLLTDFSEFRRMRFWFGFIAAGIVFSPVLIYNAALYFATSHFDLQFSYLFGQHVAAWAYLPGKIDIGSFTDRLYNLMPAIYRGLLIPQTILLATAAMWSLRRIILAVKRREYATGEVQSLLTVWLSIFFLLTALLVIGPTLRFMSMITPLAALAIGSILASIRPRYGYALMIVVLPLEFFLAANTLFAVAPRGAEGVMYSYAHYDSQRWGYNDLNAYIEKLLAGIRPALSFSTKYDFLETIKQNAAIAAERAGKKPVSMLLVYNSTLYDTATLWVFHRQLIYGGWPIVTDDDFVKQGKISWQQMGISDYYYFQPLDAMTLTDVNPENASTTAAMEQYVSGVSPDIIKLPDGRAVFAVYHFN